MTRGFRSVRFALPLLAGMAAVSLGAAEIAGKPQHQLTAVRFWSLGEVTRVAIEFDGETEFLQDRLSNPERIFFDFLSTSEKIAGRSNSQIGVHDTLLQQIRLGETKPGVTRVVLDLAGNPQVTTSRLLNPFRLMIELRLPEAAPASRPAIISKAAPEKVYPPIEAPRRQNISLFPPPPLKVSSFTTRIPAWALAQPKFEPYGPLPAKSAPSPAATARPASRGEDSMIRALGLKIRRVVLDAGHGGHDQGSAGPTGLLEKELVLDITRRLGALIEQKMGSEVIYTRPDDRFVPLESRTKIANDSKADLFLSIHANSSSIRAVSGVETYFLSFTTSKAALDTAARENASSERSVFELRDLLQKIALRDKVEESREFASRLNTSLYKVWWNQSTPARNRGTKKAPFVVLIGASMPSVLAEIGFLSNPKDESQLKKADVRQKIAEALYHGIAQYADSLSHFQVASRVED